MDRVIKYPQKFLKKKPLIKIFKNEKLMSIKYQNRIEYNFHTNSKIDHIKRIEEILDVMQLIIFLIIYLIR